MMPRPAYTREQQKAALLRYDGLRDQGASHLEACEALAIGPATISAWKKIEDEIFIVPGPWQKPHRGKTWKDMPGFDGFARRCNFALFRRGLLRLEPVKRGRPSKEVSEARRQFRVEHDVDLCALRDDAL